MFLVSVCIASFNQEDFITECLTSVLTQKTNFEYEIIIGDDASTDKTQNIIRKVCEGKKNCKLILREKNLGCPYNGLDVMQRANAKYIALIDGDDYWTDANKLQTQVDYLEKKPEISLCSHDYNIIKDDELELNTLSRHFKKTPYIRISLKDIINPYILKTCCAVFRKDSLTYEYFNNPGGDIVLFSNVLSNGEAIVLKENMATYRLHSGGVYSQQPEINKLLQDYSEYSILRMNQYKIHLINLKHNLIKNKIIDLIDIDMQTTKNTELNTLIFFLKSKYNFKYENYSYNLCKAIQKYRLKALHIFDYMDYLLLVRNFHFFLKRPSSQNIICIVSFVVYFIIYLSTKFKTKFL